LVEHSVSIFRVDVNQVGKEAEFMEEMRRNESQRIGVAADNPGWG
jgi:hypothetical protein